MNLRIAVTACLVLCACGKEPESISLTGSLGGYNLQLEMLSAGVQTNLARDGDGIYTAVTLSNLFNYCTELRNVTKANDCVAPTMKKQLLVLTYHKRYNAPPVDTFSLENEPFNPAVGKAGMAFLRLDRSCSPEKPDIVSTGGTLTADETEIADGLIQINFVAHTLEGIITGRVRARICN